jgi:glycosyltransferase involved in cell wall biosynthesis
MLSRLPDSVTTEHSTPIARAHADEEPARIRICMLAYAFYESDTRILQYATALAQRGNIVDVVALRRSNSLPEFEVLSGVNVYRIQSRTVDEKGLLTFANRILRFLFRSMWFIHRLNAKHPYDAIHVHNVPDFLVFAAIFPKLMGVPVILDIHDLLPEFYASKFKISDTSLLFRSLVLVERSCAAFASHLIIANDIWLDRLVARSSRANKCSVVRNRPDLAIFTKHAGRSRIPDSPYLLMYPGSLNWHQGLDIAIRAFASIAEKMPGAEFHIYGEGPAKPALIVLANELGLQKRVIFHDFLPSHEIAQVMAMADLAIEPKRTNSKFSNEALSTKILEFMSLGVPVIACRTKVHAYYYDDSVIQYYENDDETQLAEQILRLRHDPVLRQSLVDNARAYLQDNTWDARKHEYLELVDSMIQPNARATVAA